MWTLLMFDVGTDNSSCVAPGRTYNIKPSVAPPTLKFMIQFYGDALVAKSRRIPETEVDEPIAVTASWLAGWLGDMRETREYLRP